MAPHVYVSESGRRNWQCTPKTAEVFIADPKTAELHLFRASCTGDNPSMIYGAKTRQKRFSFIVDTSKHIQNIGELQQPRRSRKETAANWPRKTMPGYAGSILGISDVLQFYDPQSSCYVCFCQNVLLNQIRPNMICVPCCPEIISHST